MSELRRRAAPGLALAGAALATVWLFDPALRPEPTATAAGAAGSSDSGASTGAADDEGSSGGTDGGSDGSSDGDANASGGSSGSGDSSGGDPATASADCTNTTELTGDSVMIRWGAVQVRAEVAADGTLCDVQAVAYPDNDQKSSQLNASAIPYLDTQAVEAGVQFHAFSGATYTSEAYRDSLQSILDQM